MPFGQLKLGLGLSRPSPPSGGGGEPAWLVDLNFKAGTYELNGDAIVAGDLPDILGVNFAPAALTANGMEVLAANANRPRATGDLLDIFNTPGGVTIFLQVKGAPAVADNGSHELIQAKKGDYENEWVLSFEGTNSAHDWHVELYDYVIDTMRGARSLDLVGIVHRVCATMKTGAYALAASGEDVIEDAAGVSDTWTEVNIGCYDGTEVIADCYFERIAIAAALTPAEVETLAEVTNTAPTAEVEWMPGFEGGIVPNNTSVPADIGTIVGDDPDGHDIRAKRNVEPPSNWNDGRFSLTGTTISVLDIEAGTYNLPTFALDPYGLGPEVEVTVTISPP